MIRLRNVFFTIHLEEASKLYAKLTSDEYVKKMPALLNQLNNLWNRQAEGCEAYRSNLSTLGNNTNNITEASIHILKDIIL